MAEPGSSGAATPVMRVGLATGAIAGALLAGGWVFSESVFRVHALFDGVVVPGVLGNLVLLFTLRWLAARGRDSRGVVLRILGIWAVLCPAIAALVAYGVRGWQAQGDPLLAELVKESAWSVGLHSHFIGQAAVRALIGVTCAAWLLVRAGAREAIRGRPAS